MLILEKKKILKKQNIVLHCKIQHLSFLNLSLPELVTRKLSNIIADDTFSLLR